jgi:hypothetical protein
MLFVVGGRLREVHFPAILQNGEWDEIKTLSGLPDKARPELDDSIGYCRQLLLDSKEKYGTLWDNALAALREAERASLDASHNILTDEFFDALSIGLDGQETIPLKEVQAIRGWLKRILEDKRKFLDWCDKAHKRVHYRARTGEKTGRTSLFVLVQLLNGILYRYMVDVISTGQLMRDGRNSLQYVTKVCVIAQPDLLEPRRAEKIIRKPKDRAEQRVKKVIEEVLKEHNLGGQTYQMQDWGELIPDWIPAKKLSLRSTGIRVYFRKQVKSLQWLIRPSSRTPLSSFPVMYPTEPFIPKDVARRQSKVKLPREIGNISEDARLTLVFSGQRPESFRYAGIRAEILFPSQVKTRPHNNNE